MSSKPPPLQLLVLLLLFVFSANSKADDEGDAWANGDNLTPTMAIILVLSFCITACIYIYFAIIRNNNNDNNDDASSPGLPQTIIDTFPTFPFSIVKHHNIGKASLECAVCLSDFLNDDETLRLLPNCDHVFHSQCIDKWLVAHATCPVCRDNLANNLPTDDVRVTIPGRLLPRSNSTGHSPTQLGEDHERFRLIVSAEMRREIIDRMTLTRATSMVTLPRQSSSPQSYCGGGGGGGSRSYFGLLLASMKSTAAAAARVVAEGDSTAECKLGSRPLLV